jgi:cell division protein FtsL
MRENQNRLIKDILVVVIICAVATLLVYEMCRVSSLEIHTNQLKEKISLDSLTQDSLEMKILHDSLAHVDSLRVLHIKHLKDLDNENKDQRDQDINIIKHASNEQLDSMWSIYSPKISN